MKFFKLFLSLMIMFTFWSCKTTSPVIDDPENMFPSYVPTNICYLSTTRSIKLLLGYKKNFNSSGTLFEGQYLVTAGHNLYDSSRSNLVKVKVYCKSPNGNIVTSTISKEQIKNTREVSRYKKSGHSFSFDYAFIKLPERIDVEESVKMDLSISVSEDDPMEVAGYPGGRLRYGKGNITSFQTGGVTFKYDVDTQKGMSGGPVWVNSNNESYLIGIHVAEGMARTINNELVTEYVEWKNSLNTN